MSKSSVTRQSGGSRSVTNEAVIVDSFQKGSALRRAKTATIVVGIVSPIVLFVIVNAIASSPSTVVLVAVVGGLVCAAVTFVMVWAWSLVRVLWYWAGELALAGLLAALYVPVTVSFGGTVSAVAILALLGVPFVFGPSRRFILQWGSCMVMRHRLRVACDAFVEGKGVHGAVKPLILLARPTPAGETIWVWLRGSLTLQDVQARVVAIASTCWATRATAEPAGTKAAYARIDLYRRDPLAGTIENPLVELIKEVLQKPATEQSKDSEVSALNLDDIAEDEVESGMGQLKSHGRKAPPAPKQSKKPAMADAGEDVSDWI